MSRIVRNGEKLPHKSKVKVEELKRSTSQGFTVHTSLRDLDEFFRTPPEEVGFAVEPPLFHRGKPTRQDLNRSKGLH